MSTSFVPVPAATLEGFLRSLRFERTVRYNEVVYERRSARNPSVVMKVYTSIRQGDSLVRASGKDAIRVCVVFDDGVRSFGIGKFPPVPRVHSVDSVLRRLRERLVAASERGREWMDGDDAKARARGQRPSWAEKALVERLQEKADFAARERRQEAAAFLSDPDYADILGRTGS